MSLKNGENDGICSHIITPGGVFVQCSVMTVTFRKSHSKVIFCNKIGVFVVRAINHVHTSVKLSITQTQGIITCIPKENEPEQFLKIWRPITLLNTLYKITAGCIICT